MTERTSNRQLVRTLTSETQRDLEHGRKIVLFSLKLLVILQRANQL
jgi:hypothetical protein